MFDKIISFFMENIFFLVVIGGIISSLFGKEKKDTKPKRPEYKPTPTPMSQPVQKRKVKEVKQTWEEAVPEKVKEVVHTAAAEAQEVVVSQTHKELLKQQEKWRKQAAQYEAKANAIKRAEHVSGNAGFSKEELLTGIIMSEVLGPPRAKKPFAKGKG
ncbi:MAG: hypothetical protein ACI35R_11300 [Bacillus sp. (in: firmicutes)]